MRWVRVGGTVRSLEKNKRPMYYALYSDKVPIVDENGNEEFEYTTGYAKPVEFKANLSAGKSDAESSPFGTEVSYDRIISTTDMSLPIDENSIIWVKNKPLFKEDGTVDGDSADYEVAAPPLDSLNSLLIAVKRREKTSSGSLPIEDNGNAENGDNEAENGSSDDTEDDGF